jgi:tryptophanyl-tRNA synthetase
MGHNKFIFSGIQPTGEINLGGYLGAIKQWLKMQDEISDRLMFCVMDFHAITVPQDPKTLRSSIVKTIATYLACGIDPNKVPIFVQSQVPEHVELAWILGCLTPVGWLNRMTQFKSKAGNDKEKAGLGLYSYPVLMAADILIYKATHVPVGEDQIQHVELARDIAGAFNRRYKANFFPEPVASVDRTCLRIMSLKDASKKMSKSDTAEGSRINLTDSNEQIVSKIAKAVTDAEPTIYYDSVTRPEISNLLTIYAALKNCSLDSEALKQSLEGKRTKEFKDELAQLLIDEISPIRSNLELLLSEENDYLEQLIEEGAYKARKIAIETISEVRELVGLGANHAVKDAAK